MKELKKKRKNSILTASFVYKKLKARVRLICLFALRFAERILSHSSFSYFTRFLILMFLPVRLSFSLSFFFWHVLRFLFVRRKSFYYDVVFSHFYGFLADVFSAFRWTSLGTRYERFAYQGLQQKGSRVSYPFRRIAELDRRWYWKDNMAMWLPDLMWYDISAMVGTVKARWKARFYRFISGMERLADYPWSVVWSWLISLGKRALIWNKIKRAFHAFLTALKDWAYRVKVCYNSRSMLIYHGISVLDYRHGNINVFKTSDYLYDFNSHKVVLRSDKSKVVDLSTQE